MNVGEIEHACSLNRIGSRDDPWPGGSPTILGV